MDAAALDIQQMLREILTVRTEIRKLGFAYDEVQKAAFIQLETEWEEAFSAFVDPDQKSYNADRFQLAEKSPLLTGSAIADGEES